MAKKNYNATIIAIYEVYNPVQKQKFDTYKLQILTVLKNDKNTPFNITSHVVLQTL